MKAIRDYLATRECALPSAHVHSLKRVLSGPDVVRPAVDSVWAFSDTLKAYDRLMSGRSTGKVVIRIEEGVP